MFEDPDLSLKAKGFIGYCLTKKEDWKFHITHLCSVLKEGEKAIYSVINECVENGYAYRYQPRAENGDFLPIETIISDSKVEIAKRKKEIESSPNFKKCLPDRPFGDAIRSGAINAPHSNNMYSNTKEQQQAKPVLSAAVVPLASPKKKNEKPLIWPELESIDISIDQKKEITRYYSREKVQHGVKYVTHPKTVITKGLLQALKWACRVQPELPIDKTPREEMNKAYAMKYDGKQVGGAIITACNKHIELVNGPLVFALTYDSKDFMDKFTEQLRKNRIPILEA